MKLHRGEFNICLEIVHTHFFKRAERSHLVITDILFFFINEGNRFYSVTFTICAFIEFVILFFQLSYNLVNIIPWKRFCFPPFIFSLRIHIARDGRASFHCTSWLPISTRHSANWLSCMFWYLKGQPGKSLFLSCRNVFTCSTPACFPLHCPVASPVGHHRCELLLWPGQETLSKVECIVTPQWGPG